MILKGLAGMIKSAREDVGWYKEIIPDVEYSVTSFYLTNLSWTPSGRSEISIMWQTTDDFKEQSFSISPYLAHVLEVRFGPGKYKARADI